MMTYLTIGMVIVIGIYILYCNECTIQTKRAYEEMLKDLLTNEEEES